MSGNTFGTLYCVTSFGESHGPAYGGVVDGCPPGLELAAADIQKELDRRKPGTSRHVTQRRESDTVEILSGVYEGRTTGTAIGFLVRNEDQRSKDYAAIAEKFRPGHADYTYWQKYGIRDARGGGRASARETVVRVAAGAIAKKWLAERYGVDGPRLPGAARAASRSRSSPGTPSAQTRSSRRTPGIVPAAGKVHGRAARERRFLRRARQRGRRAACRSAGASRCTAGWTPTSPAR